MMARMLMSENLCICSQATLELMRIWRSENYYNTLLVDLPKTEDNPCPLSEFIKKQNDQIDQVRALLNSEWQRNAVDILREELENLDKDQTTTFFDSVAALMSNQVRELTTKSIQEYIDFFNRFKKADGRYPHPQDIITREYGPDESFEKTFLTLKLEIGKGQKANKIVFANELEDVQKELVKLVDTIVDRINNIPRADNQIANSDKTRLWDINKNDDVVREAKQEITDILFENLKVAKEAVGVYDEYRSLLEKEAEIEKWLENTTPNRPDYIAEIQKYTDTIERI
jgi:hypothetical protein